MRTPKSYLNDTNELRCNYWLVLENLLLNLSGFGDFLLAEYHINSASTPDSWALLQ